MVLSYKSKIHVKIHRTFFYEKIAWLTWSPKIDFIQKLWEVLAWGQKTSDIDIDSKKSVVLLRRNFLNY